MRISELKKQWMAFQMEQEGISLGESQRPIAQEINVPTAAGCL